MSELSNAIASGSRSAVAAALSAVEQKRLQIKQEEIDELDDESGSEDESDEEEDEYGEELTPAMDAAILRTLRMIRSGEGVYGSEKVIEEALKQTQEQAERLNLKLPQAQASSMKKFTLQDHQRQALLAQNGKSIDPDDPSANLPDSLIPLTHVQEERALREEVTKAFHTAIKNEEDEVDDFLVKKETINVDDAEAKKYRDFLLQQAGGESSAREILGLGSFPDRLIDVEADDADVAEETVDSAATEKKRKSKEEKKVRTKDHDEEFLMNYILNRGWIDPNDAPEEMKPKKAKPEVSEYAEERPEAGSSNPWGTLDEEDDFDDKADEFENTYNFRFEEPGAANIITHARNITTARRSDDTRKTARQVKAERKAEQAAVLAEKTKQEKGKKRREIEKRMETLRRELGDEAFKHLEKEMEGDWDEEVFDRAMDKVLAADMDDDEKPSWADDIDTAYAEDEDDGGEEYGDTEDYTGEEAYAPTGAEDVEGDEDMEEAPLNMDADFISLDDATSKRKQRKEKKNKKKDKGKGKERAVDQDEDVVMEDKGLTVAEQKAKVKQALEDYKKLDYEDMIGDLPTRFKYQKAAPQDYGLTPAEILMATDAELNQFLGMKHYAPYRHGSGVGSAGRGMRDRLKELKTRLATRKWGEVPEEENASGSRSSRPQDQGWGNKTGGNKSGEPKKKRKGKKERQREAATGGEDGTATGSAEKRSAPIADGEGPSKKRKL